MNNDLHEFLVTAPLGELRERRAWLADYMGRSYGGHSQMAENLRSYDEEIERRVAALYPKPVVANLSELRFSQLLECVACGLTVSEAQEAVPGSAMDELVAARDEALRSGVEREDIAPSWSRI